MEPNPYAPDFAELPGILPIFPLSGVLLLPTGNLPLNIFEPRYLAMVRDALAGSRMIGMVQPKAQSAQIYDVGCAGKITGFEETADGRFLITLNGISRFRVLREVKALTPYRQIEAAWDGFQDDLFVTRYLDIDRRRLHALLQPYFAAQELTCDWERIKEASDRRLITCLSMICPFGSEEKQALLEAACGRKRAELFMALLEMAVLGHQCGASCTEQH